VGPEPITSGGEPTTSETASVTRRAGAAAGVEAREHLERNDAYPFLKATGDLVVTGPTGTNVNDLVVVLVA